MIHHDHWTIRSLRSVLYVHTLLESLTTTHEHPFLHCDNALATVMAESRSHE